MNSSTNHTYGQNKLVLFSYFLCSFIHLIYHTRLCQHLLFLQIFLHMATEEPSGEYVLSCFLLQD